MRSASDLLLPSFVILAGTHKGLEIPHSVAPDSLKKIPGIFLSLPVRLMKISLSRNCSQRIFTGNGFTETFLLHPAVQKNIYLDCDPLYRNCPRIILPEIFPGDWRKNFSGKKNERTNSDWVETE